MLAKFRPLVRRSADRFRTRSATSAVLFLSLCAVGIYTRLSLTFERYAVLDEPRGTAVAAVGFGLCIIWLASHLLGRSASGSLRPDEPLSSAAQAHVASPKRPPGNSHLVISFCFVLRLEIFLAVSREAQCSRPGVEALLCIPLVIYEVLCSRTPEQPTEDAPDPWGDFLTDAVTWVTSSRFCLVGGATALSLGTYSAISQTTRSTYFCSSVHDHAAWDLGLQCLGLCLDSIMLILLWRVLWWATSAQARLHSLFVILRACLLPSSLILFVFVLLGQSSPRFVRLSDAVADGAVLSIFLTASSFLMCDSTPLAPLSVFMAAHGETASLQNVDRMKTWLHGTAYSVVQPLYLVGFGYSLILCRNHTHMIRIGFRVFVFFAMTSIIFSCLPISLLQARGHHSTHHPVDKLVYDSRVGADRWLLRASVSNTLRVAVSEYRERNRGRDPPPKFDVWYEYARSKKSVIIDHFGQIGDDILPFWGMSPEEIRARVDLLDGQPDVGMVRIRSGAPSIEGNERASEVLSGLVSIISDFSEHLPDMDIPVNLLDHPRVLSRQLGSRGSGPSASTSLLERRHMQSSACPAGSAVQLRQPFQMRDLTPAYSGSYSKGQFVTNWEKSLATCDQPDMDALHGFHMSTPSSQKLYAQLMPLFGRTKTGGFADIVIPLPEANEQDPAESKPAFGLKKNTLYWRGGYGDPTVAHQALRGNHKHRLAHLVSNASASDETVVALPVQGDFRYAYARVPTRDLNRALPIDVGFTTDATHHTCASPAACAAARLEFGASTPAPQPLHHRYLLLLDTDSGPSSSPGVAAALRSSSVPFVSTIFTEWFTERILPWVHFIPVDARYAGLHSTLAYFTGLGGGDADAGVLLGGREVAMGGATADAKWIASQGTRWAERALRAEDMEVYLFRLLLEWARVVDDERDGLGFVYGGVS